MKRIYVAEQTNMAAVVNTRYSRDVSTTSLLWQQARFQSKILVNTKAQLRQLAKFRTKLRHNFTK